MVTVVLRPEKFCEVVTGSGIVTVRRSLLKCIVTIPPLVVTHLSSTVEKCQGLGRRVTSRDLGVTSTAAVASDCVTGRILLYRYKGPGFTSNILAASVPYAIQQKIKMERNVVLGFAAFYTYFRVMGDEMIRPVILMILYTQEARHRDNPLMREANHHSERYADTCFIREQTLASQNR